MADARVTLDELRGALEGYRVDAEYAARVASFKDQWRAEVERLFNLGQGPPISQGEVIGIVNSFSRPVLPESRWRKLGYISNVGIC